MSLVRRILLGISVPLYLAASFSWRGDYEEARREAIDAHKILLVFVTDSHDRKSADILGRVFTNRPYLEALSRRAVGVIVYRDGRRTYPIEMYYTTVFPTLFFVDPARELFVSSPLYRDDIAPEKIRIFIDTYPKKR